MSIATIYHKLKIPGILIRQLWKYIFYEEQNIRLAKLVDFVGINSMVNIPNKAQGKNSLVFQIADLEWDLFFFFT